MSANNSKGNSIEKIERTISNNPSINSVNSVNSSEKYSTSDNYPNNSISSHNGSSIAESIGVHQSDEIASLHSSPITSVPTTPTATIRDDDTDDELEPGKPMFRSSYRTKRRASINPLPALRLNDKLMMPNSEYDTQSVISNQNSITSINSLASLLREKMQLLPHVMRKRAKKTNNFRIKLFVALLAMVIIFLIGYAYAMYHQKVKSKLYFDKIKFNKEQRMMKIFDNFGNDVISARMGVTLRSTKPYPCAMEDTRNDGSICMEWHGFTRLYLNSQDKESIRCYSVHWEALGDDYYPTDCFETDEDTQWYGGSITKSNDWPLDHNSFNFTPFITGDGHSHQFGSSLRRYFINSQNVAIDVDEQTPLQVSFNKSDAFCIQAKYDQFAFINHLTEYPELKYNICIGRDNMRHLHQQMTEQSLWDGLKEADINRVHLMIEEPIWEIPASDGESPLENIIYNYTEEIIAMDYFRLGHILVNEFWQENIGDFTLDKERFPTLGNTIDVLHRRGFKISFTIQPFISTNSPNFGDCVKNKRLIYERASEKSIPALTRYKSTVSAGVLDVTNNDSMPWLVEKLHKVIKEYQIDSFFVDFGSAYNMPRYYQCQRPLTNPDEYKTLFTTSIVEHIPLIGVSGGIRVPKPPAFLSMPPVNSTWAGLRTVIPTILTYGIIGNPFIMPGAVGGDYYIAAKNLTRPISYYAFEQPPLPVKELFIRWLQLATFLPTIRFSHLTSEYKDDYVTEIAKELATIRQSTVIPTLKKYLSDAMNDGIPLIRPLWMIDPNNPACHSVVDEFSVGDEIIVAPIVYETQTKREVYLPTGVWKDGIDGSMRKGSRWIHEYRVPKDKIAYFIKMPDNTRF